jgi:hypothetical protein
MAASSGLPLRLAAAVAISDPEGQVLLVRRGPMVDEFPGKWSFPSAFVDGGASHSEVPSILAGKIDSWLGLDLPSLKLLKIRDGVRPGWRLRMHLYGAVSKQTPRIQTPKYDAIMWVDGQVYFRHLEFAHLGDCSKAYLEYLDEQEGSRH